MSLWIDGNSEIIFRNFGLERGNPEAANVGVAHVSFFNSPVRAPTYVRGLWADEGRNALTRRNIVGQEQFRLTFSGLFLNDSFLILVLPQFCESKPTGCCVLNRFKRGGSLVRAKNCISCRRQCVDASVRQIFA
jgi:hypothetical protein